LFDNGYSPVGKPTITKKYTRQNCHREHYCINDTVGFLIIADTRRGHDSNTSKRHDAGKKHKNKCYPTTLHRYTKDKIGKEEQKGSFDRTEHRPRQYLSQKKVSPFHRSSHHAPHQFFNPILDKVPAYAPYTRIHDA